MSNNYYGEGVICSSNGMSESDNPYVPGTDAHRQWEAGHRHGMDTDIDDEGEPTRPESRETPDA